MRKRRIAVLHLWEGRMWGKNLAKHRFRQLRPLVVTNWDTGIREWNGAISDFKTKYFLTSPACLAS